MSEPRAMYPNGVRPATSESDYVRIPLPYEPDIAASIRSLKETSDTLRLRQPLRPSEITLAKACISYVINHAPLFSEPEKASNRIDSGSDTPGDSPSYDAASPDTEPHLVHFARTARFSKWSVALCNPSDIDLLRKWIQQCNGLMVLDKTFPGSIVICRCTLVPDASVPSNSTVVVHRAEAIRMKG